MVMGLHSRKHSRNVSTATAQIPPAPVEHYQIIAYLRRKPGLSKAQFYEHWGTIHAKKVAPWAEKIGAISYRQVHTSGIVIPNSGSSALDTDPLSTAELIQPVKFDGIATWEVPSLEKFMEALEDPYYKDVIAPDEHNILDKEGLGAGIVATFTGKMITVVDGGKSLVDNAEKDEYKAWNTLMKRKDLIDFQDAPDM